MTPDEKHNKRVEAFATLLNTMAGSTFTVGVAAPLAAVFFYHTIVLRLSDVWGSIALWLLAAVMLHIAVQRVLGGLR